MESEQRKPPPIFPKPTANIKSTTPLPPKTTPSIVPKPTANVGSTTTLLGNEPRKPPPIFPKPIANIKSTTPPPPKTTPSIVPKPTANIGSTTSTTTLLGAELRNSLLILSKPNAIKNIIGLNQNKNKSSIGFTEPEFKCADDGCALIGTNNSQVLYSAPGSSSESDYDPLAKTCPREIIQREAIPPQITINPRPTSQNEQVRPQVPPKPVNYKNFLQDYSTEPKINPSHDIGGNDHASDHKQEQLLITFASDVFQVEKTLPMKNLSMNFIVLRILFRIAMLYAIETLHARLSTL